MRYKYGYHSGFTLIELLVVISIIGVLSSVVLASINSARNKAKDAAIRAALLQMRNVYELEMTNNNSYANLVPKTTSDTPNGRFCFSDAVNSNCNLTIAAGCTSQYGGSSSEAEKICKDVLKTTAPFTFGLKGGSIDTTRDYALTAKYTTNSNYFCVTSSGKVFDANTVDGCLDKANW